MKITVGDVYMPYTGYDLEQAYIVTGVGISHVLYSPIPLMMFNNEYIEHCVTISQFIDSFYQLERK